eukprot:111225-Pelagomonas_calceolata.AAC.1
MRQPHKLTANQQHVHLIEIKCCEDMRPGQQLEALQRHYADFCKHVSGKSVTLHTILLGVGGTCYTDQILVAGVEEKMPSIGGCQWEALSLMHTAERQV